MSDPGRLAITVSDRRGYTSRITPEEVDAANLLQDLQFSSSAPGGHKDCSFQLLRDLFPRLDEVPFNRVTVYGAGGKVVWAGRMATLARQTGANFSLAPTCVGMQAHLGDDTSFMEVFADRDPSSWTDPPLARRGGLAAGGFNISSSNGVSGSTDAGGLVWEVAPSVPAEAVAELWYRMPGSIRLKAMEYADTRTGTWTGIESPRLFGFDTPTTGQISTTDGASGTGMHEVILATAKRYGMLRVYNASGGTLAPAAGTRQVLSPMAVYGGHGLSRYFYTSGQPSGVKGADVVANIVARAAPLLNFTTGTDGTIQPTGTMIIPHLVFRDPVTAADAIQSVNKFYGWDWLVWGDDFYYQPAGSGTVWQARKADGASLSPEGPSADELWNGALVTFTDVDGETKIAGPPNTNAYDYTSTDLVDAATDNPVNLAGIPRRWLRVDVTSVGPMNDVVAVQLGRIQLAEANMIKRRGQVTLQGTVRHPSGVMVPVSEVRAGDAIQFVDMPGDEPRRLDEVTYSHATRTAQLGVNGPLPRSEGILERLQLFTSLVN